MNLDEFYDPNLRIQFITDKGMFTDDWCQIEKISELISMTKKRLNRISNWATWIPSLEVIACRIKIAENIFIGIK